MRLFEVKKGVIQRSEAGAPRIKTEGFLETIRSNCLENLEKMASGDAPVLYRGMEGVTIISTDYAKYGVFERRTSPRESKTGNNMILNWVSGSPTWSGVPKRQLSSSCTLSKSATKRVFGPEYVVVPFDDVRQYAWMPSDFNYTALDLDDSSRGSHIGHLNQSVIPNIIKSFNALAGQSGKKLKGTRLIGAAPTKADLIYREIKSRAGDMVFSLNAYTLRDVAEFSQLSEEIYALLVEALDDEQLSVSLSSEMRAAFKAARKSLENLHDETSGRPLHEFLAKEVTPKSLRVQVTDLSGLKEIESKGLEDTAEVWFVGGFIYIDVNKLDARYDLNVILKAVQRGY
jgi:hypothetical protein